MKFLSTIKKNSKKIFPLIPIYKDYLWGGTKLIEKYHKKSKDCDIISESWEYSTHPKGISFVDIGNGEVSTLNNLLGFNTNIIIKFINSKENLSIQVHPSDNYAKLYENESYGKTEMWYVLDAEKDSFIYYGFSDSFSREILTSKNLLSCLNKIKVEKGDVFFVYPGIIHAIGKGCTILEVQESSNLTYRIYDYDRKDKNGNRRELHLQKASEVLNFNKLDLYKHNMKITRYFRDVVKEIIWHCPYFYVGKMLFSNFRYKSNSYSYTILILIEGSAKIIENKDMYCMQKGNSILLLSETEISVEGNGEFIEVIEFNHDK